jgi:hypothetical protein
MQYAGARAETTLATRSMQLVKELSPMPMGRSTLPHGRMTRSTGKLARDMTNSGRPTSLRDKAFTPSLLEKSIEAHSKTT